MEDKILRKRFQTTMIGALYEFEKSFGYLWGSQKPESEPLTEKEERFLDLWEDTRNRVLNTGNDQLRKAITEIQKSSGKQTYNYRLPVRKGNYED
jgi:hypothetical protein